MNSIRSVWRVLTPRQRSAAVVLFGMMLVSMVLEMLSVGMVVPALAFMSGDFLSEPTGPVAEWLAWLGNPSRKQLILGGLVVLSAMYAIKSLFLVFVHYWQSRYIATLQSSLSQRIFASYLAQPWTFHLAHNSVELNRNIGEVQTVCNAGATLLNAAADTLVTLGIVTLLLVVEPVGALVVGCLLVFAALVFDRLTAAPSRKHGVARHRHTKLASKIKFQSLGAAKDVKVHGCEAEFVGQFATHATQLARAGAHHAFFAHMPRLWYELLAVGALSLFTAILILQDDSTKSIIPTLGLFATAAFRLLPSVNRLSHAVQTLRYQEAPVATVARELELAMPPIVRQDRPPLPFRHELVIDGLSFRYSDAGAPTLDDVSFTIAHGTSVGIIGASGAGKSTLVDLILGLLTPTAGRITVDGFDIQGDLRAWRQGVGYVPQSIYLFDDTIRRNIAFGLPDAQIDDAAVERAIQAAQLDAFIAELPKGLDTVVGERGVRLSGGQRQRIGIARALYRDPAVLVLDEATSALDDATERGVMRSVNALHGVKTLLIVAHRLTTVEQCDVVHRLDRGRIIRTGSFAEVTSR
jgi:ABC-type multidrug transport system fused ATPase/permease subunit